MRYKNSFDLNPGLLKLSIIIGALIFDFLLQGFFLIFYPATLLERLLWIFSAAVVAGLLFFLLMGVYSRFLYPKGKVWEIPEPLITIGISISFLGTVSYDLNNLVGYFFLFTGFNLVVLVYLLFFRKSFWYTLKFHVNNDQILLIYSFRMIFDFKFEYHLQKDEFNLNLTHTESKKSPIYGTLEKQTTLEEEKAHKSRYNLYLISTKAAHAVVEKYLIFQDVDLQQIKDFIDLLQKNQIRVNWYSPKQNHYRAGRLVEKVSLSNL